MSAKLNKAKYVEEIYEEHLDENFEELFSRSLQENNPKESTITKGVVINIDDENIYVDIGTKSEGIIPGNEFGHLWKEKLIKVGDIVDVFVEKLESRSGSTILSREKAIREETWLNLEELFKKGQNVDGVIFGKVKGGFTVDLNGIIAFLPGSQVDVRPIKDISPLIGMTQPFQIFKIDRRQGNIVVSRRAILEESRAEARDEMLSQIHEGMVMDGIVKNITNYGAFIDLGSIDGLLHVTDISWKRITHPSEMLSIGQNVKVMVTKYNPETKRVSLGMKQLESNPWANIEEIYPKGSKVKGKISNLSDFGAFIELGNGIEGLVHVSEISWTKNNPNPKKVLAVGQEVECLVLEIDTSKPRISLGIKQCEDNPWANFASRHEVGSTIEGEIRNIVDFGIFVGFEGEIDGLIHVNDISWEGDNEAKLKNYKKGEIIKTKVLAIDVDKERISLGIKQLSEDTMGNAFEGMKKGDIVNCVISNIDEDQIEVMIKDSIPAIIKRNDLAKDRSEQRTDRFKNGEKIDAKIINIDKASRKIILSVKALEIDEHKKTIAEYSSETSGASLGDILGAAINQVGQDNKNQ